MNLSFLLNFIIWVAVPWTVALPPQQTSVIFGDLNGAYEISNEPIEVPNNDLESKEQPPPMTFTQLRRSIYDQQALDFYLSNLEKFIERSRMENENYIMEAEVTAPETTTETVMETTTETVEINETTQNLKSTTSDILPTTEGTTRKAIESSTVGIEPSAKKSNLWKNLKSFVNNFDDDFNPLEPISKVLDDMNTGELWNNFTSYAADSLTCLNKFSSKSSKAMKKNIVELEEKVIDSWKSFKQRYNLMMP